ncbi:Fc receptor-like protein 6 [Balaenoptera acutorostrata]|uniref:Fc receptor-like protein 6 n=1 Tax=Balaenoptera acutorostrata TaxID=9767 RepID=A0A452C9R3_BALAC|nr:Fc receptor-like protein 6 [Balaenoptera acutorostrata]
MAQVQEPTPLVSSVGGARGQPLSSSSPSTRRATPCKTGACIQNSASQQPRRETPGFTAVCCPGSCVLSSAHLETHQPSCGAPPLRSSFYLSGDTLRNHVTPLGGAVSFLFPVTSEQDAGNHACEAENSVSKETSKPETLSVEGPRVLSAPTSINWLVPWLPASLLGMTVIAAALLGYFRPWRKTVLSLDFMKAGQSCFKVYLCSGRKMEPGPELDEEAAGVGDHELKIWPLPPRNLPPAPGGEEHPLYVNVHCQNENDEGVIYSVVRTIPKESEARPAQSAQREKVRWDPCSFLILCVTSAPSP